MLAHRLHRALAQGGDAICVEAEGRQVSYSQLASHAAALAAAFARIDPAGGPVAILCDHSILGYAAVAAALITGRTYVPLKPGLPADRIAAILQVSAARVAVGDEDLLADSAEAFARTGCLIAPGAGNAGAKPLEPCAEADPVAYVMFTSGSTGAPKGVVLRASNLAAYCDAAAALFPLHPDDRCTQLFDLSFDLSVHDVLLTFLAGARLVVDARKQRIDPVGFAAGAGITVWFSVPSVLSMARRFRRLRAGVLPSVRLALFCGEALPVSLALGWLDAAPNARSFNVYGPTEATIAITWYELGRQALEEVSEASVPIGVPYSGSACVVVREDGGEALPGEPGELWLGGPQLAEGYLGMADLTAEKFVEARFAGYSPARWYRTGDLAALSDRHGLLFRGRIDHQVKIGGYRVELDEIESVIRRSGLVGEVTAFAFDLPGGVAAIACALTGLSGSEEQVLEAARAFLPNYMVPSRLLLLEALPLNQNGKVDRNALKAML